MLSRGLLRNLVYGLFFLSGVSGLVYEVVWTRFLVLFLGNTAYANAVVLATFMGGLGLGYWRFGRVADRLGAGPAGGSALLALYARLEAGIGLYGLAFPSLMAVVSAIFFAIARRLGPDSVLLVPLSLASTVVVLVGPAVLMGGTLPVLLTWATRRADEAGREVSRLYAVNSAGAVVGGALAGFLLVERLGQRHTVWAAALLNLALAGVGYWLSRRTTQVPEAVPAPPREHEAPGLPTDDDTTFHASEGSRLPHWLPTLVAAAAGFAALVLEVAWMRLFALIFGSATQTFTVVVCTFIAGIAAGSALAGRVLAGLGETGRVGRIGAMGPIGLMGRIGRISAGGWARRVGAGGRAGQSEDRVLTLLAVCGVASAALVILLQPAYAILPYELGRLRVAYAAAGGVLGPWGFFRFQVAKLLLCLPIMVVPTVLSGFILPLATHLQGRSRGRAGHDALGSKSAAPPTTGAGDAAGRVLAWNALGSVVGAALAGTVLIPHLGLRGTLLLAEWVYLAVAAVTLAPRSRTVRRRAAWLLVFLAPAAGYSLRWDLRALDAGEFRRVAPVTTRAAWLAEQRRAELVLHEDGVASTVSVFSLPDGKRFLKVNGKTDASNWGDVLTAAGTPAVGALAATQLRSALVVGFGSGATVNALLKFGLDVDVLEIEPAVLHAAPFFTDVNDGCLGETDRVHVHIGDARTWLQIATRRYDVIVNEPSNPWVAGVGALFTRTFFQSVRARLDEGGSFVQWFHLYDMDDDTLRLVLRTLLSVFPNVSVWHFENDIALVARVLPMDHDLGRMAERFGRPSVRAYFNRFGVYDLFALLSLQLTSEEGTRRLFAGDSGPLHDDDLPLLEYRAPRAQFDRSYAFWLTGPNERRDERRPLAEGDAGSDLLLGDLLRHRPPTLNEMIDFTLLQSTETWSPEPFRVLYLEATLKGCTEPSTLGRLVMSYEKDRRYREAERALVALEGIEPASARTSYLRSMVRLRRLGAATAAHDPIMRGLLESCSRAPSSDAFPAKCRATAESLAIRLPGP